VTRDLCVMTLLSVIVSNTVLLLAACVSVQDASMFDSILSSKLVQEAVTKVSAQEKVPRDVIEERAARDLQELVLSAFLPLG
jgi:hypothetical protein